MNTNDNQNQLQVASEPTPATLLQMAVANNLDIEKLEKLMVLQERWNANNARKTFLEAMSKFQSIVPPLKKTKVVDYVSRNNNARTNYKFASLGDITAIIKDAMFSCGLSYRWELSDTEQQLTCTCIVSHVDGHSERTGMSAGKDNSGGKNEIQQRGSTTTYLQRYTLIAALGLSTADEDNDGQSSHNETPQQLANNASQPEVSKPDPQKKELPWLDLWTTKDKKEYTKQGAHTINKLASGEITLATVKEHYRLNQETEKFLLTIINKPNNE